MGCTRREFLALASIGTIAGVAGCTPSRQEPQPDSGAPAEPQVDLEEFKSLALDMGAWKYDADNDVYYQLGLTYCKSPATKTYESLAVFVPGAYFSAEKNGSSFSCTVDPKAVVGGFTPSTAPVLMPINTGTLAAQMSPTVYGYQGLAPYLEAGCIYVYAGFRGRSAGYDTASGDDDLFPGGSPWPVVDLKAAVRYLRYNADVLPCDPSRVFVFGFGAGGGVSAVLGASGDSEVYRPYLESIGAVTHDAQGAPVSDAIAGSASWCPSTSFDVADAAYEWSQGQYATTDSRAEGTWTRQLSQDMACAYGAWVNEMDLRGSDDAQLTLDETSAGAYSLGSYAEHLLGVIDEAATDFVRNTPFPYAYTPQTLEDPFFPGDPNLVSSRGETPLPDASRDDDAEAGDGSAAADSADGAGQPADAASATEPASDLPSGVAQVQSTIYGSPQDYFASLNSDNVWINYSIKSQEVSVSSLRDFSQHVRPAAAPALAFDSPDRATPANQLFGVGEESTLHFDAMAAELVEGRADAYATLAGWKEEYATAWSDDLEKVDSLDSPIDRRVAMMNPLYWLSGHYEGYGQANVAPHWRINEGLFDSHVPLCCAQNVVLALSKYDGVADVAYTPVWGQGHVLAERSGTATSNLVQWVISCCSE